jgi:membrane protease YdiL (CAAX protease family)
MLFFVVALIAPFSEEILFRGYFLRALRRPFPSRIAAILASAFFFGAFHPGLASLLPIGWAGAVFATLFLSSPRCSLLSSIVCHSIFNAVELALTYALVAR